MMELTTDFLQQDHYRKVVAVKVIGKNRASNGDEAWIFSSSLQVDMSGTLVQPRESKFILLNDNPATRSLQCPLFTPLDEGSALKDLYSAVEAFMPDNSIACLATMACAAMGASYQSVIYKCGHIGVPFLIGDYGSCKSQASMCALSTLGAQETHNFNNQTTTSYLFEAMRHTTIPVAIDDISERSQDTWEELIVDVYNSTPRGTRAYNVERFATLPILSANWQFSCKKGRAFTRCIVIPFMPHKDEPDATKLYGELAKARRRASASVGAIVKLSTEFSSESGQKFLHEEVFGHISAIYSNAHARFKSTMSTFMYFFLKVNKSMQHYNYII